MAELSGLLCLTSNAAHQAWHKRLRKSSPFKICSVPSVSFVVNCMSTALERWQEHEGQGDDNGGEECAQKELQWADAPVFKLRLQN